MKRAFLLTISFLMLTGVAEAESRKGEPEAAKEVEISARVIAISADSKSMELFDSASSTMIQVNLKQLPKAERSALMLSSVRRVSVSGRASTVAGRMVIEAQKIVVLPITTGENETSQNTGTDNQR